MNLINDKRKNFNSIRKIKDFCFKKQNCVYSLYNMFKIDLFYMLIEISTNHL